MGCVGLQGQVKQPSFGRFRHAGCDLTCAFWPFYVKSDPFPPPQVKNPAARNPVLWNTLLEDFAHGMDYDDFWHKMESKFQIRELSIEMDLPYSEALKWHKAQGRREEGGFDC